MIKTLMGKKSLNEDFCYDVEDDLQLDGSVGTGLSGKPSLPFWATLGFKIVRDFFRSWI